MRNKLLYYYKIDNHHVEDIRLKLTSLLCNEISRDYINRPKIFEVILKYLSMYA